MPVRGGEAFRGVIIGTDQLIPLALSLFSAIGIRLDDDPDRVDPHSKGEEQ